MSNLNVRSGGSRGVSTSLRLDQNELEIVRASLHYLRGKMSEEVAEGAQDSSALGLELRRLRLARIEQCDVLGDRVQAELKRVSINCPHSEAEAI